MMTIKSSLICFSVAHESICNKLVCAFHFSGQFVSDFEAMLARKRELASKRRKRRDIDIINDNDDIIDQLIQNMRQAAEVNADC